MKTVAKSVVDRFYGIHPTPEYLVSARSEEEMAAKSRRFTREKVKELTDKSNRFLCAPTEDDVRSPPFNSCSYSNKLRLGSHSLLTYRHQASHSRSPLQREVAPEPSCRFMRGRCRPQSDSNRVYRVCLSCGMGDHFSSPCVLTFSLSYVAVSRNTRQASTSRTTSLRRGFEAITRRSSRIFARFRFQAAHEFFGASALRYIGVDGTSSCFRGRHF